MLSDTHHIIEIPEKGITKYMPKTLAHCNANEFVDVARLLYRWQSGEIDFYEFRILATYALLNLKRGKRRINNIELEQALSNIASVSMLIDSFFDTANQTDKRIILNIIENPVPFVRPIFSKIQGPKARFTNTNFGQYEDASNYYYMYYRTHDTVHLYQLFATYYQDAKSYRKENTETRAAYFKKSIDFAQVYSFFLFFESFQNYVTSSKVLWEGKVIDLSILFSSVSSGEQSSLPGLGTKSLAFQVAESGVFGSLKELRSENLWEILLRLYDLRKRDLDAQAQQKKADNK